MIKFAMYTLCETLDNVLFTLRFLPLVLTYDSYFICALYIILYNHTSSAAHIGEECTTNVDCLASTIDSQCTSDDKCECSAEGADNVYTDPENGLQFCYEKLAGEECNNDEQCLSKFANQIKIWNR